MIAEQAVYLDCPYRDKDDAKRLGARFDGLRKQWFVPAGRELTPFSRWLPAEFDTASATTATAETNGLETETDPGHSLSHLLAQIRHTLQTYHGGEYWVRAEVVNVSGQRHRYFELAEYDANGQEVAKARAALWQQRADSVLNRFSEATGLTVSPEMKLLLKVAVELHPVYGFSLLIQDIDPAYTLGEMAAKIARIRNQLIAQGVYQHNRSYPLPVEFCRLAVIAPPLAAGLGDFQSQAHILSAADVCEFVYYPASFQGKASVEEIPRALATVLAEHQQQPFDAVILIRGGGAKADLYQLNEYEIVHAVCTAPLPVIIGIGHERDRTLLDEVACHAAHTPSLVAALLTRRIVDNARSAAQHWQLIQASAAEQINQARWHTEQHYRTVREQAVSQLNRSQHEIALLQQAVQHGAHSQLQHARHQLKLMMEHVLLGDPKAVLKRGFVLVRNAEQQLITQRQQARQTEHLTLEFHDGQLQGSVQWE